MNQQVEQVVVGSLLGDATIWNGMLQERHCEEQKKYLFWKQKILENKFKTTMRYIKTDKKYSKQNQYCLTVWTSPIFREYYKLIYKNGKKTISRKWLDKIGKLAIVVWYFDDGCYLYRKNSICLATCCFSRKENMMLIEFLKEKFSLNFSISTVGGGIKKNYVLACYGKNSDNFLKFIKKNAIFIPKCFIRKMGKFDNRNIGLIKRKTRERKEYWKRYFKANKEKVLEHSRDIYYRNIDKNHQRAKIYYQKNRDEINKRQSEYQKGRRRMIREQKERLKKGAWLPSSSLETLSVIQKEPN